MAIRCAVLGLVVLGACHPRAESMTWSGTIEVDTASLGSRTGGRVAELLVREGDRVVAGQPLVRFEPGALDAQHRAANADLTAARARLTRLVGSAGNGARREQIAAQIARLVEANAAAATAERDAQRARTLANAGAIARADAEHAEAEAIAARARVAEAGHGVRELKKGTVGDVDEATAAIASAQARLDEVDVQRAELLVRAPKNGRVEVLSVRPGDIVPPNGPVAVVVEQGSLYLRLFVPETQLGHIRVGQHVPVRVDSFRDRTFDGVVSRINLVGEFSPRNLQTADQRADHVFGTRVDVVDPHHVLKAGMAAFVEVSR